MQTLQNRLKSVLEAQKMTQTELARLAGISTQSIQQLLSGKAKKTRYIVQIATALNVNPIWLENGEEQGKGIYEQSKSLMISTIPIFYLDDLNKWVDNRIPDMSELGYLSIDKNWDVDFAIKIQSDSMESLFGGVSFPIHSLVLASKNAEVKSGDFVLAKPDEQTGFIFRQYIKEGNLNFLKPLNVRYNLTNVQYSDVFYKIQSCIQFHL